MNVLNFRAPVAQLVEHRVAMREVVSSVLHQHLGPVQTSHFTCAESNANERKQ